jgi:putative transposase
MPSKPRYNRHSIRLPGYDYTSPRAYFITICTYQRACLFGEISGGEMHLSSIRNIAHQEWLRLPARFSFVTLDDFVVMPNHIHGIIWIHETGPVTNLAPRQDVFGKPIAGSLSTIMRAYKTTVTIKANKILNQPGALLWQANFWERVVRGEPDFDKIRQYIQTNPAGWPQDRLAPL